MKKNLAAHIPQLADQYHGLTFAKCKETEYEFAVQNNLDAPNVSKENKIAEKGWW